MSSIVTELLPSAIEPQKIESIVPEILTELRQNFGVDFTLWAADKGEIVHRAAGQPEGDESMRAALVASLSKVGEPELIDDADGVVALAIPLEDRDRTSLVAISAFVTRHIEDDESIANVARLLNCDVAAAWLWIRSQETWNPRVLLRLATNFGQRKSLELTVHRLGSDVEKVSKNLTDSYEELCLIYGVTQNLRISSTDSEMAQLTLDWLAECIPTTSVAVQFLPVAAPGEVTYMARTDAELICSGECPLDCDQFTHFIETLGLHAKTGPFVANDNVTSQPEWQFDGVRQVIVVPLVEADNHFGWLAAFNHEDDQEFGTVEASLLNSIGTLLGIHAGNRELYRQLAELVANVVRALTSAIDAKDSYTCGHSDRVARVAVRLATELGCDQSSINTMYMAGLLHDVGKIGIDDTVLRKPGRLTEAEFEHIKLHPEFGHNILSGIKQFEDVLPIVLHHHEQWDGNGYPHGLKEDQTPYMARIAAVADAYDAMSSDRPYRKGMVIRRVEEIFRAGAGKQWDPKVIAAFFKAREDILQISQCEREELSLDVARWRD
jgi:HD-GYP domain-containing protein (c-di-GMP phosphodiesterase class II)